MSQPAPGVPRLKTSDALDIQNKSLNGSMSGILNVSQGGGKGNFTTSNTTNY